MEHLAIMDKETILKILSGEKKVESRFSKNKISPFNKVNIDDTVYLKESGGKISALFKVDKVIYFDNLSSEKINNIKIKYNNLINAPKSYWEYKKDSNYGTLIFIKSPKSIKPFNILKNNRLAFLTVNSVRNDLPRKEHRVIPNTHDCKNNKHIFNNNSRLDKNGNLLCCNCNKNVVDWNLTKSMPNDINLIFNELKKSKWNYDWFTTDIDTVAKKQFDVNLDKQIIKRLNKSIRTYNLKTDGKQTPYAGDIIYYAQHATATCCRNCIQRWYGISKKEILTDEQINYFNELIKRYIDMKIESKDV